MGCSCETQLTPSWARLGIQCRGNGIIYYQLWCWPWLLPLLSKDTHPHSSLFCHFSFAVIPLLISRLRWFLWIMWCAPHIPYRRQHTGFLLMNCFCFALYSVPPRRGIAWWGVFRSFFVRRGLCLWLFAMWKQIYWLSSYPFISNMIIRWELDISLKLALVKLQTKAISWFRDVIKRKLLVDRFFKGLK